MHTITAVGNMYQNLQRWLSTMSGISHSDWHFGDLAAFVKIVTTSSYVFTAHTRLIRRFNCGKKFWHRRL